jgi:hypothetical protein
MPCGRSWRGWWGRVGSAALSAPDEPYEWNAMARKRRLAHMAPDPLPDTLIGAHPVKQLDLHGFTAAEAEAKVRDFIMTCTRSASGQVVRIVMGKGTGSAGRPVLGPLVGKLLATSLAPYVAEFRVDSGRGSYVVRIK